MKKLLTTILIAVGLLAPAAVADAYDPYVAPVRVGDTFVITNTGDVPAISYGVFASKTNVTCTADGAFWSSDHVTYTRLLAKYGTRYVWVYRYVYDGENVGATVPAHTTLTVSCK